MRQPQYESIGIMVSKPFVLLKTEKNSEQNDYHNNNYFFVKGSKLIGDISTTLILSLVIYLIIEAPCRNILNHVISMFTNVKN